MLFSKIENIYLFCGNGKIDCYNKNLKYVDTIYLPWNVIHTGYLYNYQILYYVIKKFLKEHDIFLILVGLFQKNVKMQSLSINLKNIAKVDYNSFIHYEIEREIPNYSETYYVKEIFLNSRVNVYLIEKEILDSYKKLTEQSELKIKCITLVDLFNSLNTEESSSFSYLDLSFEGLTIVQLDDKQNIKYTSTSNNSFIEFCIKNKISSQESLMRIDKKITLEESLEDNLLMEYKKFQMEQLSLFKRSQKNKDLEKIYIGFGITKDIVSNYFNENLIFTWSWDILSQTQEKIKDSHSLIKLKKHHKDYSSIKSLMLNFGMLVKRKWLITYILITVILCSIHYTLEKQKFNQEMDNLSSVSNYEVDSRKPIEICITSIPFNEFNTWGFSNLLYEIGENDIIISGSADNVVTIQKLKRELTTYIKEVKIVEIEVVEDSYHFILRGVNSYDGNR